MSEDLRVRWQAARVRRGFGASDALVERNLLAAGSRVQRDTLAYLCALANARWNAGYNALQAHILTRVSCAFIRLIIRAILREPTRVELAWQNAILLAL
jgi:enhancing lycopene biosynthesis protein 2